MDQEQLAHKNAQSVKKEVFDALGGYREHLNGYYFRGRVKDKLSATTLMMIAPAITTRSNKINGRFSEADRAKYRIKELSGASNAQLESNKAKEAIQQDLTPYLDEIRQKIIRAPSFAFSGINGKQLDTQPSFKLIGIDPCGPCQSSGKVHCHNCNGHGKLVCGTCSGRGTVKERYYDPIKQVCYKCRGTKRYQTSYPRPGYPGQYDYHTHYCNLCDAYGNTYTPAWSTRTIGCSTCSRTGKVNCGTCSASGTLRCGDCEGHGEHSTLFSLEANYSLKSRSSVINQEGEKTEESIAIEAAYHQRTFIADEATYEYRESEHEDDHIRAVESGNFNVTEVEVTTTSNQKKSVIVVGGQNNIGKVTHADPGIGDEAAEFLIKEAKTGNYEDAINTKKRLEKLPGLKLSGLFTVFSPEFKSRIDDILSSVMDLVEKTLKRNRNIKTVLSTALFGILFYLLATMLPFSVSDIIIPEMQPGVIEALSILMIFMAGLVVYAMMKRQSKNRKFPLFCGFSAAIPLAVIANDVIQGGNLGAATGLPLIGFMAVFAFVLSYRIHTKHINRFIAQLKK